jgi:hypothetical protein
MPMWYLVALVGMPLPVLLVGPRRADRLAVGPGLPVSGWFVKLARRVEPHRVSSDPRASAHHGGDAEVRRLAWALGGWQGSR